jgi:transcriptional regulator with XRE-family HTH domain
LEKWKELRDNAGLTLDDLAARSGYGKSTINGLEKHGVGSARLKKRLLEILAPVSTIPLPGDIRNPESVSPGVAHEPALAYRTSDEWKRHAEQLKAEVKRLRAALRALTDSEP